MQSASAARRAPLHQQVAPDHLIIRMAMDISRHTGPAARVLALLFGVGTLISGAFEWRWDLVPTIHWFEGHGVAFQTMMGAIYGQTFGMLLLIATPFIVKAAAGRWVGVFVVFDVLFIVTELFDFWTNWDGSGEVFAGWDEPSFLSTPIEWVKYMSLRVGWNLVCTSVFQIFFIGCMVCFIIALWNSFDSWWKRAVAFAGVGAAVVWFIGGRI